jgi:hypothetical protein
MDGIEMQMRLLPDLGDVVRMHDLLDDLTSGQITDDAHRTRGTESITYNHYQLELVQGT